MNGYVFLCSAEDLDDYDGEKIDKSEKLDFDSVLKSHFPKLVQNGNYNHLYEDDCKLFYGWKSEGEVSNFLRIQYSGRTALDRLINLGKAEKLSVMISSYKRLINLTKLPHEELDKLLLEYN